MALAGMPLFALGCGSPTEAPGPTTASGESRLQGTVTAGPTCPVERPGQVCPPVPVDGVVVALDGSGEPAASTPTSAEGHYVLALGPGTYTLRVVVDGPFPVCPETPVAVGAGAVVTVDVSCDTGIR